MHSVLLFDCLTVATSCDVSFVTPSDQLLAILRMPDQSCQRYYPSSATQHCCIRDNWIQTPRPSRLASTPRMRRVLCSTTLHCLYIRTSNRRCGKGGLQHRPLHLVAY